MEPPGERLPVPQEVGDRHQGAVEGEEGGDADPEEAVEEGEAGPIARHQATVSVQHQDGTEHEAEVEAVEVGVANDVAKSDEGAAESRPPGRLLLQEGGPAKEEEAEGTQEAWGRGWTFRIGFMPEVRRQRERLVLNIEG